MKPGRLDLTIYRGDTYDLTVKFRNKVDDTPIDLSGRTFGAQIRRVPDAFGYTAIEIDTGDAAIGVLLLHLDADTTAKMQCGGEWDLQETDVARVTTLLRGSVALVKDVTQL